jgi:O-antigen/teichoic acid export membrane protein
VGDGVLRAARRLYTPERGYYLSQIYPIALGIVATPFLLRILDESGYAVVAFGNVLFVWLSLLDIGFSGALSRWLMLPRDGQASARATVSAVFTLSLWVGIPIFGGLALCSDWIAAHWFALNQADHHDLELALTMMAIMLLARWAGTVPRAVLYGQQRLAFLAWSTCLFSTLRQILCIPLLYWWQGGLVLFFLIQLIITFVESLVLSWPNRSLLRVVLTNSLGDYIEALRPLGSMAFALGGTSLLWIAMSQTDRLVLSTMIGLHDYGVYSVAMVVAGGISALIGPMALALLPKLVDQVQSADSESATVLAYRRVVSRLVPLGLLSGFGVAAIAEPLIVAWTGDRGLAAAAAPILALYALGNGIQVISGLPYFLQYAKGDLRLHLIGNLGFALLFLLGLLVMVPRYGAWGAGFSWLVLQVLYAAVWVSFVHRRLVPSYWLSFLWADVLPMLLLAVGVGVGLLYLQAVIDDWLYLLISFMTVLGVAGAALTAGRSSKV